jgi:ribosomal protein S18 acetylase RimI-like enzyme
VIVRRARLEDAGAVAEVFLAARAEMDYLPRLHTDEETRAFLADAVVARQRVYVAEEDGAVVGFAALQEGMLEHLYVHPAAQSRGFGSALLEEAKRACPGGFRFWVFQRNEGARRFYEARGCRLLELTDGAANEEREPDALYAWP